MRIVTMYGMDDDWLFIFPKIILRCMLKYYTVAKCEYLLYFTRRFSIVTAVRFVIVDFKEMNE